MLEFGFPVLARLKGLRGTPLDLFGHTAERKMERGLIADYEATVEKLISGLTRERLPTAVKIAQVPQMIRGYGHIKDASVGPARFEEKKLWKEWDKQGEKELAEA
jgi:indolepyruvate ferredoxin oxidoreductase